MNYLNAEQGSLADYLDNLQSQGCYSFTRTDAHMKLGYKEEAFEKDIIPSLSIGNDQHNFDQDFDLVWNSIIPKLPDEPWSKKEIFID